MAITENLIYDYREINDNDKSDFWRLDEVKRNVFFILGCPCAGKTTVAKILAQKNNMYRLSGDERRFEYYKYADKAKHKYMTMDAQSFGIQSFSRKDISSPGEMANEIERFFNI